MSSTAPGRRSARRRRGLNITTVLGVLLPLACAIALFLVRPADEAAPSSGPERLPLTRATLVCPSGEGEVAVTSAAPEVAGEIRVGGEDTSIATDQITAVAPGPDPVTIAAEGETAPGLVAARLGDGSAAACLPPSSTSWFTGVGAGAGHRSVLELTNPDSGTAVADITVYGRAGVVEASRLRGISVPGRSTVELDLASIVPRRDELSLQVVTARGRIGATLLDRIDPIGSGAAVTEWLPAQSEPATSNLLLGLESEGEIVNRTLIIANGSADEVRASIEVVTEESVFAPRDVDDLRIPPQSTARVVVGGALAEALEDGSGLLVTANEPVTATVRTYAEGDLSLAVPDPVVRRAATVVVPEGAKRLLLAGATGAGAVRVVARTAAGEELATRTVEVVADRGYSVPLPDGAALVTVTPARAAVSGAVLATGDGTAVVPLVEPVRNGLLPAVRPGLP